MKENKFVELSMEFSVDMIKTKRIACFLTALLVLCVLAGCSTNQNDGKLYSGYYLAQGDYARGTTPYVTLDTEKREFSFCEGALVSYAESGTYSVQEGILVATTQSMTFRFDLKDSRTLVLIDEDAGAYFEIPVNAEFVYSEEIL